MASVKNTLFSVFAGVGLLQAPGRVGSPPEAQAARPASETLIAIDVLLEPDATMVAKANALNARLRGNYPAGYALDATHAPHVTLLQRFVREKDFAAVTAAIAQILAADRPAELELKAHRLDYTIWGGVAVTVILVEPTPELLRLQRKVADAVAPFAAGGGTAAAFVGGDANAETIAYVETFVPKASGPAYLPHVTAGVATETFMKQVRAEPFAPFTFKPAGVAIYQLGNFGTASKRLWPS
jgi:2'-5' RNA ligase superfamily protein